MQGKLHTRDSYYGSETKHLCCTRLKVAYCEQESICGGIVGNTLHVSSNLSMHSFASVKFAHAHAAMIEKFFVLFQLMRSTKPFFL